MKVTADQVRQTDPCRDPEQYLHGRPEASLLQILEFEDVPIFDRIWLVTRFTTDEQDRAFSVHCADAIKKAGNVRSSILSDALKLAKQYVDNPIFQIEPPDPDTEEMKTKLAMVCRQSKNRDEVIAAKMLRRALQPECQFWAVEHPTIYAEVEKLKELVFDIDYDLPQT